MKRVIRLIKPDNLSLTRRIVGVTIIAVCLFLIFYFWSILRISNNDTATVRFNATTDSAVRSIQHNLEVYSDVLYGGRALMIVNPNTTRAEWNAFIDTQNIGQRYPGIDTIAYIEETTSDKVGNLTTELNDNRLATEKYPITIYPEPFDRRIAVVKYTNGKAVGYNILSDVRLSQMATNASVTGLPQATTLDNLTTKHRQFVGYTVVSLAVYDDGFGTQQTAVEHRLHTTGYVVLLIKINQLLESAFDTVPNANNISLRMSAEDSNVVYGNKTAIPAGRTIVRKTSINVGGQQWNLEFAAPEDFGLSSREVLAPRVVFVVGLLSMMMIFTMYFYSSGVRIKRINRIDRISKE